MFNILVILTQILWYCVTICRNPVIVWTVADHATLPNSILEDRINVNSLAVWHPNQSKHLTPWKLSDLSLPSNECHAPDWANIKQDCTKPHWEQGKLYFLSVWLYIISKYRSSAGCMDCLPKKCVQILLLTFHRPSLLGFFQLAESHFVNCKNTK